MVSEKDDYLQFVSVQINGQYYYYWSYVMENFLKGKRMWSYVDGTSVEPTDKKDEATYAKK